AEKWGLRRSGPNHGPAGLCRWRSVWGSEFSGRDDVRSVMMALSVKKGQQDPHRHRVPMCGCGGCSESVCGRSSSQHRGADDAGTARLLKTDDDCRPRTFGYGARTGEDGQEGTDDPAAEFAELGRQGLRPVDEDD